MKFKTFYLIIIILLLLTIGGLILSSTLRTPQQLAAETNPPPTSRPTVTLDNHPLTDTLPVRCTPTYRGQIELKPLQEPETHSQYTKIAVTQGEKIIQGSFVAEINGQPVFAGIGGFNFYRDLHIKDQGPDAMLLNILLTEMGYQPPRPEGYWETYDNTTHQALASLYQAYGYRAPTEEEGFKASSFIVLKTGGTVIDQPRDTGTVGDQAIATLAPDHKSLECVGLTGQLPSSVKTGQTLRLPGQNTATYPISLSQQSSQKDHERTDDSTQNTSSTGGDKLAVTAPSADFDHYTQSITAEIILSADNSDLAVVPEAALWTEQGQATITKIDGDQEISIPVAIEFSAHGLHKVRALDGSLGKGDTVRIFTGE